MLWLAVILGGGAVWALWPAFEEMSLRWSEDPTYSHGYLVPLFSIALLWIRRDKIARIPLKLSPWGLPVIALAGAVQYFSALYYFRWGNAAALMLHFTGIAIILGGWPLLRATWQSIAFLVFMIPLPYFAESALRNPLRRAATLAANFVMQMIGLPSVIEGTTVIDVNGQKIGVAEACSGLAMLMTFVALAFAVAILIKRPWLDRVIILLSAVPIAILCNIIRITITGICYATVGEKWAKVFFHDIAGWLMMPMAVGFMGLILLILDNLLIDPTASKKGPPIDLVPGLDRPTRPRVST